jgi:hypothetical protein
MSDPTRELNISPTDFDTLPTLNEEVPKAPHDPDPVHPHINPKMASDIRYWGHQFGVSGQILHEAIRVHGTSVEKVRAALEHHQVSLNSTIQRTIR